MENNIKIEKQTTNFDPAKSWRKLEGFQIWECKIFDMTFHISNQHEANPNRWFLSFPGIGWEQLELEEHKYGKDAVYIAAFQRIEQYFKLCAERAAFNYAKILNKTK